jgi:NSS family neurotransmitter:Na+ symporter
MPVLFVILMILVVQGLMLPGADKGTAFLFSPDWSKINPQTFLLALGHAFFTLSLGMGAMMTYGSYLSEKDDVVNASYMVAFLDTVIAILAGVAIFTVVFSSGYDPAAGPGLVFHVLPPLLAQLAGGYIFALLFFLLLTIAAVTSGISILEVSVAYLVDELKYSRKKATLTMGLLVYLAAIPCALSFNLWSDVTLLNTGFTFFDAADYLASNILLPLGGFFLAIFAGYVWGVDEVVRNLLIGDSNSVYFGNSIFKSPSFNKLFSFLVRYLSPILIFLVFLYVLGWI